MKKLLLFVAFATTMAFTACTESPDLPMYVTVDGEEFDLSVGYISDNYYYSDEILGGFDLDFGSSSSSPSNFLSFTMLSASTSSLQVGSYSYKYYPGEPHLFTSVKLKTSAGHYLTESNASFSGTVKVSKANDNFLFEFDIVATAYDTDEETVIKGEFNETLKEGSIN